MSIKWLKFLVSPRLQEHVGKQWTLTFYSTIKNYNYNVWLSSSSSQRLVTTWISENILQTNTMNAWGKKDRCVSLRRGPYYWCLLSYDKKHISTINHTSNSILFLTFFDFTSCLILVSIKRYKVNFVLQAASKKTTNVYVNHKKFPQPQRR